MSLKEIYLSILSRQIQFDQFNSNIQTHLKPTVWVDCLKTCINEWQWVVQRVTRGDNELQRMTRSDHFGWTPLFWIIWCWCEYLKNEKVTLSTFFKLLISNVIYHFVTVALFPALNNCWQIRNDAYRSVIQTLSNIYDGTFCKNGLWLNPRKKTRKERMIEKQGFLLKSFNHGTIIRTGITCKKISYYMRDSAYRYFEVMINIFEFFHVKENVEFWLVYLNTFSWIIQSCFLTETIKRS